MFSFLKRKKGQAKLVTILSKRMNTSIFSHSGTNKSSISYTLKVMHTNGKTEEIGVTSDLFHRAQQGGRLRLFFEDSFLDKIVFVP